MAIEPFARVMLAFGKPDDPAVGKIVQRRNQVFPDGRIVLNEISDGCHRRTPWREGSLWRLIHAGMCVGMLPDSLWDRHLRTGASGLSLERRAARVVELEDRVARLHADLQLKE